MSLRQWTAFVLWLATVLSVAGQNATTNVTQCIASYNWSINSLNQTPCLVAAYLENACGSPTGINISPIPDIPGDHYLGPSASEANPCLCSSVTYSMISACAGCQNRTYIDWSTWSDDCTQVSLTTFPKILPPATVVTVPSWAFLNVTLTGNNFSVAAAEQNATSASISSSAITTGTSVLNPTPTTVASASKSKSDAGAVAGGVVGGLVFLAIIVLVALWFRLRRKRNTGRQVVPFDSRPLVSGSGTAVSQTTGLMQGPSQPSQSIYTSDMSIYPGSPLATSGVFTSGVPPSRRSLESVSLSLAQFGAGSQAHGNVQPRGYTGMPEI